MNRILRAVIASTAVAATTLAPIAASHAGERYYRDRGHHSHRYDRPQYRHYHRPSRPAIVYRDDAGAAVAAGILGLAVGAIIAGAASAPPPETYAQPYADREYFPEAPGHQRTVAATGVAEPWTTGWYRYCADRFRSFDSQTGTYLGYDGKRHFCVAR